MKRTIEQWTNCNPKAMAEEQSDAAKMYAFQDAKADILELHAEIERLRKRCSPSRVVMIGDVGHYVSEGVAEGIESLRQAVKPFAEFDLLEHRIPPEFAMLVLRARGALERVVVTPNEPS